MLRNYLVEVLEELVIALGNGVFGVFKDEALKTSFLQSKFKRQTKWQNLRASDYRKKKIQAKIKANIELIEDY